MVYALNNRNQVCSYISIDSILAISTSVSCPRKWKIENIDNIGEDELFNLLAPNITRGIFQ